MSLKEQLNNYTEQPDAELYARIEKSLRRRRMARRSAVIAPAAAAAVVGLVLALRPAPQPQLAQLEQPEIVAPAPQPLPAPPSLTQPQPATPAAKEDSQLSTLNSQLSTQSQLSALPATATPTPTPTPAPTPCPAASSLSPSVETAPASSPSPAANETAQTTTPNSQLSILNSQLSTPQPSKTPVIVDPEDVPEFYIPNAFAPEGDDPAVRTFHFTLRPGYEIDNFKLYIFNRGGRQVFYSTSLNSVWDGTFKGAPQPMGNYVYKMQYRDADGNLKVVAGNVMLIRK